MARWSKTVVEVVTFHHKEFDRTIDRLYKAMRKEVKLWKKKHPELSNRDSEAIVDDAIKTAIQAR